MRKPRLISILLILWITAACHKNDRLPEDGMPLTFATMQTKSGLSSIYDNFMVWGSTRTDEGSADIMSPYRVNYDQIEGWTYTEGEGTESQELQYWNGSASAYCFHAGAPASRVTIDASSVTLDMASTTSEDELVLYSSPYLVKRTDPSYGNIVNLSFNYAHSKINLAFKYVSVADVTLSEIKLIPPAEYTTTGTLAFNYNWDIPFVAVGELVSTVRSSEPISFPDVSIAAGSYDFSETSTAWYMIPDPSSKGQWTLSMKIDGNSKETVFTLSKAWEAGKSYTYRFEYTDKANLVFIGTETELFVGEDPESGGEHNFS